MTEIEVQQARKEYNDEIAILKDSNIELDDNRQAALFAKILIKRTAHSNTDIMFCNDNEMFVSKTPTGYDVVGYYTDCSGTKSPFNITVCKINDIWYPSRRYIAADTHACSGTIILWILLSLGCTLVGILMYYIMSAAIGI